MLRFIIRTSRLSRTSSVWADRTPVMSRLNSYRYFSSESAYDLPVLQRNLTSINAETNSRIDGRIDGLYREIRPAYKPEGFESLVDREVNDPQYGMGINTGFKNYHGYFYRNFDPDEKIFTFNHGFSGNLPPWVRDVTIPLVQGKGIPTQVYFTLRQMKLLNIPEGDIQIVRMSQIQNLDTAAFIHNITGGKIIYNFDSVDILAAPSNEYMKTVMIQAGYEIISGNITGKGQYMSVRDLKNYDFPLNPKFKGSYEAFMEKYGLSWYDMLYLNYNIIARVRYTQ